MRNSIKNVSTLYGGISPTIDIEDDSADLMVIQREDMVIHHTSKLTSRYKVEEVFWVTKTLGYNAMDEVIYIITDKPTRIVPDFIPAEVL
jgi:hypothetical protein